MQCQHRGVREDLGHAFKSRFLPPQIQVALWGWELLTEDKVALNDPKDFDPLSHQWQKSTYMLLCLLVSQGFIALGTKIYTGLSPFWVDPHYKGKISHPLLKDNSKNETSVEYAGNQPVNHRQCIISQESGLQPPVAEW